MVVIDMGLTHSLSPTMPRRTRIAKPTLNSLIQEIYDANLSQGELQELLMVIEALKELSEPDPSADTTEQHGSDAAQNSRLTKGCIEAKMINGCGPYLYLRYYKGCRNGRSLYGSKYLGKADS